MGRPKKYEGYDIYASQREYSKTKKGKAAKKRYNATDSAKASKREWKRKHDGTIIDRRQHFIDTYGDIETALKLLDKRQQYVIIHLNGLDGSEPMTQKEVGKELFLTGSRIGQIKDDALDRLEPLKKKNEKDADHIK